MSKLSQMTISELLEEIESLQEELALVTKERDELREQKERAEYSKADHDAGQADLAHTSGERR
ncbi:hypothetical protein LCGC14_1751540 [marine sediment metagenome]|uniref:Uncharacterized protein n=1 Tax=marine sediment metagenome TaxID=412755 RepID=A0A0F9JIT9_9ZZZZ